MDISVESVHFKTPLTEDQPIVYLAKIKQMVRIFFLHKEKGVTASTAVLHFDCSPPPPSGLKLFCRRKHRDEFDLTTAVNMQSLFVSSANMRIMSVLAGYSFACRSVSGSGTTTGVAANGPPSQQGWVFPFTAGF